MVALPQYDYIFAFAMIFSFLDAWNIGANDVANSFATSVSSRSLTMLQAMCIATVCEFGGAVLAGARVSGTIKNGIIKVNDFSENPSVLMLGMLCALVGSSLWLTLATKVSCRRTQANLFHKYSPSFRSVSLSQPLIQLLVVSLEPALQPSEPAVSTGLGRVSARSSLPGALRLVLPVALLPSSF